jgi:hypothetical protein
MVRVCLNGSPTIGNMTVDDKLHRSRVQVNLRRHHAGDEPLHHRRRAILDVRAAAAEAMKRDE